MTERVGRIAAPLRRVAGSMLRRKGLLAGIVCAGILTLAPVELRFSYRPQGGGEYGVGLRTRDAWALFGMGDVVYDPVVDASVISNGSTLVSLLGTMQDVQGITDAAREAVGIAGSLGIEYPLLNNLLTTSMEDLAVRYATSLTTDQLNKVLAGSDLPPSVASAIRGQVKDLAGQAIGGVSTRLLDFDSSIPGVTRSLRRDELGTPAQMSKFLIEEYAPKRTDSQSTRVAKQQAARKMQLRTTYDCAGMARSQLAAIQGAPRRLKDLSSSNREAQDQRSQQGAATGAALQSIEELVGVQALLACMVLLQTGQDIAGDQNITDQEIIWKDPGL